MIKKLTEGEGTCVDNRHSTVHGNSPTIVPFETRGCFFSSFKVSFFVLLMLWRLLAVRHFKSSVTIVDDVKSEDDDNFDDQET